jgi:hypothetical protein
VALAALRCRQPACRCRTTTVIVALPPGATVPSAQRSGIRRVQDPAVVRTETTAPGALSVSVTATSGAAAGPRFATTIR